MTAYTATYSPEDNKLRLYASTRLDPDTYARVKTAGFSWAPKQELFVAPMWTPSRADICIELAGEIEDESSTMAERAEQRAERFDEYSDKRATDSRRASDAVHAIGARFEFGQPILIGHHSERKARKDAERMENGMRRAVNLWETSEYWTRRAAAAKSHADYKSDPAVRGRRIKGLEADLRKQRAELDRIAECVRIWDKVPRIEYDEQTRRALFIAGRLPTINFQGSTLYSELYAERMHGDRAWRLALDAYDRSAVWHQRWHDHYANRIAYERAMLDEGGGLVGEQVDMAIGGEVLIGSTWYTVTKINRKDGRTVSVSTNARYCRVRGVEEIQDYRAPTEERAALVKAATTKPPLCNYPGPGFVIITKAEWDAKHADYKGTLTAGQVRGALGVTLPLQDGEVPHRVRSCIKGHALVPVFVEGYPLKLAPKVGTVPERVKVPAPERDMAATLESDAARAARAERTAAMDAERAAAGVDALKDALRAGVQVVSAPQLFPTPPDVAARMVDLAAAHLTPCARVLEPSAGTGALLKALRPALHPSIEVVAVEINRALADGLRALPITTRVDCADFLAIDGPRDFTVSAGWSTPLGLFDAVLMNPPFGDAADIKHVQHARRFLKPGGILVGICAGGPRQHAALQPLADSWEDLPSGTFDGTGVRSVLFTIRA